MRDKFTELIDRGVAEFKYTPIIPSIPEQDYICRMYNNIFSIPSDTHMSNTGDGNRVITGHMIQTENWKKFIYSTNWGAVNFTNTGYWSLSDFLCKHGLCGCIDRLNGDIVYMVTPKPEMSDLTYTLPKSFTTTESKIPQPLHYLTTDNNINHIKECFMSSDVVKALNESLYVKGNNWIEYDNKIVGVVNNKVIIMEDVLVKNIK